VAESTGHILLLHHASERIIINIIIDRGNPGLNMCRKPERGRDDSALHFSKFYLWCR